MQPVEVPNNSKKLPRANWRNHDRARLDVRFVGNAIIERSKGSIQSDDADPLHDGLNRMRSDTWQQRVLGLRRKNSMMNADSDMKFTDDNGQARMGEFRQGGRRPFI